MKNNNAMARTGYSFFSNTIKIFILVCAGMSGAAYADVGFVPVYQCGSNVSGSPSNVVSGKAGDYRVEQGYLAAIFDRDKNNNYTLFESGPVRPLALSDDKNLLFVTNLAASCLEIYDVSGITDSNSETPAEFELVSTVAVGVDPVSVAVRNSKEVWVVNHISDSVSVVKWDTDISPHVTETLQVGDEPRDIVFADSGADENSGVNARDLAFITTAARGQHDPDFSSMDLFDAPDAAADEGTAGLARVWVFNASNMSTAPIKLKLFTTTPRALAVSANGQTVYAAGFLSGNTSTQVSVGDPNNSQELAIMGVKTTEDGLPLAQGAVIVKKDSAGIYRDETMLNGIDRTDDDSELDWTDSVADIADRDVFRIDIAGVDTFTVSSATGVGTALFNMVTNENGTDHDLFISNTDALNFRRFVAEGSAVQRPEEKLRGHFVEHNVTWINTASGLSTPKRAHLNDHLTYTETDGGASKQVTSLAQPTDMVVDNGNLYVAGFGSRRIGVYPIDSIKDEAETFAAQVLNDQASFIQLAADPDDGEGVDGGGPAGLAIGNQKLFVYTRFDNKLRVYNTADSNSFVADVAMATPENATVIDGRPFLYDANISSANGTAACGSCHAYGDFDQLAWDLGNLKGGFHGSETLPMSEKNPLGGSVTNLQDAEDTENGGFDTWILGGGYFPDTSGLEVGDPITVKGELTGKLFADGSDPENIFSEATFVLQKMDEGSADETGYTDNEDKVYLINQTQRLVFNKNIFRSLPYAMDFTTLKDNWVDGQYICLDGSAPDGSNECVEYAYTCNVSGKDDMQPFVFNNGLECVAGRTLTKGSSIGTYKAYKERWSTCVGPGSCESSESTDPADWLNAHVNPEDDREIILVKRWWGDQVMEFVGGTMLSRFTNFTTAKGVMTTQTLRGIADSGALHWRGDKTGCRNEESVSKCLEPLTSGEAQEERAFKEFNEAFVNLLGKSNLCTDGNSDGQPDCTEGLTTNQMQSFTDFIMQITMPPNPVRALDNVLTPDQEKGRDLFMGKELNGGALLPPLFNQHAINAEVKHLESGCNSCHLLDENKKLFGTDKSILNLDQPFKVPQLRSAYQKVGLFEKNLNAVIVRPDGEGKGSLDDVVVTSGAFEVWTLTAKDSDEDEDVDYFLVRDSENNVYPNAEVDVTYTTNDKVTFKLTSGTVGFEDGDRFVVVARNATKSIAGFGYLHDGSFASIDVFGAFFQDKNFNGTSVEASRAISDFMMAFPSNMKPVVGQQLTIRPSDFVEIESVDVLVSAKRAQFDVLTKQAAIGNCDLVVTGVDISSGTPPVATPVKLVGERSRAPAACAGPHYSNEDICLTSVDAGNAIQLTDEAMLMAINADSGLWTNGVTLTCGAPGSLGQVAYYDSSNDLDSDFDGDGVPNQDDAFPTNAAAYLDSDGDGRPDLWDESCDTECQEDSGLQLDAFPYDPNEWGDGDMDRIGDNSDNCVDKYNPLQADLDEDNYGNACDYDVNNDEFVDKIDRQLIWAAYARPVDFGGPLDVPFNVPVLKPESEFNPSLMNLQ